MELIAILLAIPVALFILAFLRAFTAKQVTGKWPHEDETSKKIYEDLP
ncbi:hypothetical protein [Brucella intermedia]|nr:hypothetical protein [Brucella intermedia]